MKTLRAVTLVLLLAQLSWEVFAARVALVIGIDNYTNISSLRNAGTDAQTIGRTLREIGYRDQDVHVIGPTRNYRDLKDDIRTFSARIRHGDQVLFYFSGHGVQIGADNYLLPSDVRSQTEAQVKDDALPLTEVLQTIRQANPTFTLAVIDACRDNPFQSKGRSIGSRGLAGVSGATGQMVIYAAGEGQQALDRLSNSDPIKNGVFTRVFAQQIRRPGVSVRDVLQDVREEVHRLAKSVNHMQVPAVYDQVLGRFYFVDGPSVSNRQGISAAPSPQLPVTPESAAPADSQPTDAFVYFVQVGAYTREEEAVQRRAQLSVAGYTSSVSAREQSGRSVYRVRIGPFQSRNEADNTKDKLAEQSIEAHIVRVER